tara:strand:- start:309 stop:1193 length:885 start_codon:yes stop_codon:yes gene_type:complete
MAGWKQIITSGSSAELKSVQTEKISGNSVSMEAQKFQSTGSFSVGSNQYDISNPLYSNDGGMGDRDQSITISGEINDTRIVDGNQFIGSVYFLPPGINNLDVVLDFGSNKYISEIRVYPNDVDISVVHYSLNGSDFTKVYDVNDVTVVDNANQNVSGSTNTFIFEPMRQYVGRFWKIEFSRETSGYLNEIEFKIKEPGFVVREDFLFESGSLFVNNGDILPSTDKGSNLGSEQRRFANIYAGDLELSNEHHPKGGNEVDGTTGNWTIQEGEEDLYLLNRKNGKRYKFLLQNIDE